jgi:hypothetical protein
MASRTTNFNTRETPEAPMRSAVDIYRGSTNRPEENLDVSGPDRSDRLGVWLFRDDRKSWKVCISFSFVACTIYLPVPPSPVLSFLAFGGVQ